MRSCLCVQPWGAATRAVLCLLGRWFCFLTVLRHAQVAALSSVLDKDLGDRAKTSEVNIPELLALNYASLFDQEADRRLKKVPVAFYQQAPSRVFDVNALGDWGGWDVRCPPAQET